VQRSPDVPPLSPVLLAGLALRPFPVVMLQPVLDAVMLIIHRRHPDVFDRLSGFQNPVFLIDPIDLPCAFILTPETRNPRVVAVAEYDPKTILETADAVIRGPLMSLMDLLEGRIDGDSLFFSRDLMIEGNTECVVALRNAVDGAEINVTEDILALFGPLAGPLRIAKKAGDVIFSRATQDLAFLRDAVIAPSMHRHAAIESQLHKLTEKIDAIDRKSAT